MLLHHNIFLLYGIFKWFSLSLIFLFKFKGNINVSVLKQVLRDWKYHTLVWQICICVGGTGLDYLDRHSIWLPKVVLVGTRFLRSSNKLIVVSQFRNCLLQNCFVISDHSIVVRSGRPNWRSRLFFVHLTKVCLLLQKMSTCKFFLFLLVVNILA